MNTCFHGTMGAGKYDELDLIFEGQVHVQQFQYIAVDECGQYDDRKFAQVEKMSKNTEGNKKTK